MIARVLVGAAALLVAAPSGGQEALPAMADEFERAWSEADVGVIAAAMAPDGIRLSLGGESHLLLSVRQARAAIGRFLSTRESGVLERRRVEDQGGDPRRGSAEFRWSAVARGTSEAHAYTIFVGYRWTPEGWRITVIRVF